MPINNQSGIKKPHVLGGALVLRTARSARMMAVRSDIGCDDTTPMKEYNRTKLVLFTSPRRPVASSDNDGKLPVSAYRGIGSETVRCPVVVTGRDPNIGDYRLVGSAQEVPAGRSIGFGHMDASGYLTTRKSI